MTILAHAIEGYLSKLLRVPTNDGPESAPTVFVVDDDASVRRALNNLLRSAGFKVRVFESAVEMLEGLDPNSPSCLVLDVRLPQLDGLQFQSELAKLNISIPIIFITGHGDIPMGVHAMKAGAVDFLTKPFNDRDMLAAVASALERDRKVREDNLLAAKSWTLFDTLTLREREVMVLVTAGLMNKQVAGELGLSEITVKIHRRHVMTKMGARSLPDLVRIADFLGFAARSPSVHTYV